MELDSSDESDILHYAVEHKTISTIKSLLEQNIGVNGLDKNNRSALHIAVLKDKSEIVQLLIEKGANVNIKEKRSGLTPLHLAIKKKNLKLAKLLLEKGADINEVTKHDSSALHIALKNQDAEMVKLTLNYGANIDATKFGRSPLHMAAESTNIELAKLLLLMGSKVNNECMSGLTPLHVAIEAKNTEMVQLLLKYGAATDKQKFGKCPLFLSVDNGSVEIADILSSAGRHTCYQSKKKCFALEQAFRKKEKTMVLKFLENGFDPNTELMNKYFLHLACKSEWADVVQLLLTKGANVSAVTNDNESALHVALENKDNVIGKLLLLNGADVNIQHSRTGITPIHLAVRNEMLEVARLLLSRGANPSIATHLNITPMHMAFESGNRDMIISLLEYNADTKVPKHGKSLLEMTIENNWLDLARELLERGADANTTNSGNSYMLMMAVRQHNVDMVKLLLDFGAQVNFKDARTQRSPLQFAAYEKNIKVAELLIARGAEVNYETEYGTTALQLALERRCKDMVRLLLENGSVIEIKKRGLGALHVATSNEWYDIVEMLLDRGADVNELIGLYSPLMFAVDKQDTSMARLLIDRGADVNCLGTGRSPLHVATSYQLTNMVELLLDKGARINEPNHLEDGIGALHIALKNSDEQTARILIERNASVNMRDRRLGYTPLHLAVEKNCLQIVEMLLARVTRIDGKDYDRKTPLHLAVMGNKLGMAELLIEHGANVNNTTQSDNSSCLHYALVEKNQNMLKLLLSERATIYAGKRSAFQAAVLSKEPALIQLLLHYDFDNPKKIDYVKEFLSSILLTASTNVPICEMLIKHLVRKNIRVSTDDLNKYAVPGSLRTFQDDCDEEITKMKNDVFYEKTTFYDVLMKNSQSLSVLANNKNLVTAFDNNDFVREHKYPIYETILTENMNRAKEMVELNNEAQEMLAVLFRHELPHLLNRQILSYLPYTSLRILKKLNSEFSTVDQM